MNAQTTRFATTLASLPDRAQAPLWQAWSTADDRQRQLMIAVAERTYRTRNALPDTLADRLEAVSKLIVNLQAQYKSLCKPWRAAHNKAVDQWQKQHKRPLVDSNGTPIPITNAERARIFEIAHQLAPKLGFDKPNETPCINSPFDRELKTFLASWPDLQVRALTQMGQLTSSVFGPPKPGPNNTPALMRALAAIAAAVIQWRKRINKIAKDIFDRIPRPGHGLPRKPNFGGLALALLILAGVVVLK